jgi:hypothetical protein
MLRISFRSADPQCYVIRRQIADPTIVFFRHAGYRCEEQCQAEDCAQTASASRPAEFRPAIDSGSGTTDPMIQRGLLQPSGTCADLAKGALS